MKVLFLALLVCIAGCTADPKAGEIWRYEHVGKVNNPFDPEFGRQKIDTEEDSVIEVKEGWVKYIKGGLLRTLLRQNTYVRSGGNQN
jgi:hypothetical protein